MMMRKLIFILSAIIFPAFLFAQDTPLSSLYNSFSGEPGFETTEILPATTSFEWEKDMDVTRVKEMMKTVESIRIVQYNSETDDSRQEKAWKKIQKAASDERYLELMNVKADDAEVHFYRMAGDAGRTREVALLVKENQSVMLLTMTGDMDMSAIFSKENMEAFQEMGKYLIDNKKECPHHD